MFGEMRDSPMTGEFKHCEMCDITNDDGIIHVTNCPGTQISKIRSETNSASNYITIKTNSTIFGKKLNFIITPTWTRYLTNQLLLLPTVHINTHTLAYNYTLFRALIKTFDFIQNTTPTQLNYVFNGNIGTDPGHLHLHITDQPISYIDEDNSPLGTYNHQDKFIKYICISHKKDRYSDLIRDLSIIYDQQVSEMAEPKQPEYLMGVIFQIKGDVCKIFVTIGKRLYRNHLVLPHLAQFFSTNMSRSAIEQIILSEPEPYITRFKSTRSVDRNFYNDYTTQKPMVFVLEIVRSLSDKNLERICQFASTTNLLEHVWSLVSRCPDLEQDCQGSDLYTYLLNLLTSTDCKTSKKLEVALINKNMSYYNKLIKDSRSIYLDGALASRLFNNLDYILRNLSDPDTIYHMENTHIGEESAYGIIRPASIRDNQNFPVVIKFQRRKGSDDQSRRLFENSYLVGNALNYLRNHIPNFILTLGKVDCLSDNTIGRHLADRICYSQGEDTTSIIMEKISDSISLNEYYKNIFFYQRSNEPDYRTVIRETSYRFFTIIYQLIIALIYAHDKLEYCHNDLHPGNILVVNTSRGLHEYNFGSNTYWFVTDALPIIIDYDSNYVTGSPDLKLSWRTYDHKRCVNGTAIYSDLYSLLTHSFIHYFQHVSDNGIEHMAETDGIRQLFTMYIKLFGNLYMPGTDYDMLTTNRQFLHLQRTLFTTNSHWNFLTPNEIDHVTKTPLHNILEIMNNIYQTRYQAYLMTIGEIKIEYIWGDIDEVGCKTKKETMLMTRDEVETAISLYGPNLASKHAVPPKIDTSYSYYDVDD